jgi:AraC-like DNA-binding protein
MSSSTAPAPAAPSAPVIVTRQFDQLRLTHYAGAQRVALGVTATAAGSSFLLLYVRAGSISIRTRAGESTVVARALTVVPGESGVVQLAPDADVVVARVLAISTQISTAAISAALGRTWLSDDGTASLVGRVLDAMIAQPDYRPADPSRLAQHVTGLISLLCGEAAGTAGGSPILQRAQDYIERHLGEGDLTPDRIAAVHNVSTRTLHRMFESQGSTLGRWIRERRLERCRAELLAADAESDAVSVIAARWGLTDAAHFSRIFKASYGVSPRTYRLDHRGHRCDDRCPGAAAA